MMKELFGHSVSEWFFFVFKEPVYMTKFESSVKMIAASQAAVYEKLSDLNNLEKVKDRLPEDKVKNLTFDAESLSVEVPPVGKITLQIVEKNPANASSSPPPPRRCPSTCGYRYCPRPKTNAR